MLLAHAACLQGTLPTRQQTLVKAKAEQGGKTTVGHLVFHVDGKKGTAQRLTWRGRFGMWRNTGSRRVCASSTQIADGIARIS
ncbi:hypothetical protein LBMAG49_24930 [Planctomycetota bacterium]|nr:hypothetical protein LBMAG49_24930 [Planctomycetota bacterium]